MTKSFKKKKKQPGLQNSEVAYKRVLYNSYWTIWETFANIYILILLTIKYTIYITPYINHYNDHLGIIEWDTAENEQNVYSTDHSDLMDCALLDLGSVLWTFIFYNPYCIQSEKTIYYQFLRERSRM